MPAWTDFLAQGTLYPDVIESVSAKGGPSATIKTHHNVGGLPEKMDLELIEPRSAAFINDYFTERERSAVADHEHPDLLANLTWSAKESALKVLRTGLRSDTRTVEVAVGEAAGNLWQPLVVANDDGRSFPGWWLVAGDFILTCATERATDPPVSLTDPHGLTDAIPAHAWMDGLD